jgi:hypothetical protein
VNHAVQYSTPAWQDAHHAVQYVFPALHETAPARQESYYNVQEVTLIVTGWHLAGVLPHGE